MTNTTYVLDTSILLSEGKRFLTRHKGIDMVIPLVVIKELESKRADRDLGRAARSVLSEIRRLQTNSEETLTDGVDIVNDCTLRVEMNNVHNEDVARKMKSVSQDDVRILSVAVNLSYEQGGGVYLVTKDIPLVIFANMFDIPAGDLNSDSGEREYIDNIPTFEISTEEMDALFEMGHTQLDIDIPINSGAVLKNGSRSALAISKPNYSFTLIKNRKILGKVEAKSKEQTIAMKQLQDDTIKAVSLGGVAGGGKTMLALAAGVEALDNGIYKKIVVFRSMQAVGGEELGYLPGTEQEKLDPWTAAVYDALGSFLEKKKIDDLKRGGKIQVLPITHVRGRTLAGSWVIVDEAQNLSKDTIYTLISRLGHSSKIILTHDISQRDNYRVGRWDGIYDVVSQLHGSKLFGHTAMKKSERSELAQLATDLLDDY